MHPALGKAVRERQTKANISLLPIYSLEHVRNGVHTDLMYGDWEKHVQVLIILQQKQ